MATEAADLLHQQYHLAQINIALMKAPLSDPGMAEFAAALNEVNAVADQSPGFVWRLQSSSGNATDIQAYPDPRMLVNLSVWQSVEQLKVYVYKSLHGDFLPAVVTGLRSTGVSILPCGGFPMILCPQ